MSRRRWSRRWVVAAHGGRRRERARCVGERARRQQRQERESASCGTVTMDENAWAGATANVYVLKYVLEKNLGCKVNIEKLPESTPLFQAMADGKVDVVPEDWNNIDLKVNQKYLSSHTILRLGSNGVIGRIGWFIPTYLMKQHPEFKTWQGLKGKERHLQEPGVRLAGDVPRRRPVLRAEGRAADQAARPQLQVRLGRCRAGAGGTLDAGVQAEEADPLLLVHAAVPQQGVPALGGQAAAARQELRRLVQPEAREQLEHLPLRVRARRSSTS